MYIPKQRMSIALRFRLRAGQNTGDKPRQLYIRLSVDGITASDYASGVKVRPDKWNPGYQKVIGYSKLAQETNRQLEEIEAEHKEILAELTRLYKAGVLPQKPTAIDIRERWQKKTTIFPTVADTYASYISYLRSLDGTQDARHKRTLDKWENGRTYLSDYITAKKSEKLTIDALTIGWTEGYYNHLLRRPLGKASAARFVGYLRASINYVVAQGKLSANPIANYFPDKGRDKPVYFLEEQHLLNLWALESDDHTHGVVRDWLLLMCYTGLDQPDLERYVDAPASFHKQTDEGIMIVIERGKTGLIACIPLLPEVDQILSLYPKGIPKLTNQTLNRWTWIIEKQIDFDNRLTTKICRKTAGAVFLKKGFFISEVSKILGHASLQTTLRNYTKITGDMVKAGMKRVNEQKK